MHTFVQWLGGAPDSGGKSSFLFCLPTQRALFGVGEGTQRVCLEHNIRLAGNSAVKKDLKGKVLSAMIPDCKGKLGGAVHAVLSSVWLKNLEWSEVGGLGGLLCTVADAGSVGVRLIGPPGLKALIVAMRPFMAREGFALQVQELLPDHAEAGEWIQDGDIRVLPIYSRSTLVGDEPEKKRTRSSEDQFARKGNNLDLDAILRKMFPGTQGASSPALIRYNPTALDDDAKEGDDCQPGGSPQQPRQKAAPSNNRIIGWWIAGQTLPGRFHPDKAKALGIPVGPVYAELAHGRSVTLADGRTILPEQVADAQVPAPLILYAADPSAIQAGALPPRLAGNDPLRLECVIHDYDSGQLSKSISFNEELLREGVVHVCTHVSEPSLPLVLKGSYEHSVDLRARGLPVLIPQPIPSAIYGEGGQAKKEAVKAYLGLEFEPLVKVILRPQREIISASQELPSKHPLPCRQRRDSPTLPGTVTFLGTAACIPGKYRNVSAIHIALSPDGNFENNDAKDGINSVESFNGGGGILLDCGEGTLGQMLRAGIAQAPSMICLTHLHADHHLGTLAVIDKFLEMHKMENGEKAAHLTIIAPHRYFQWLEEAAEACNSMREGLRCIPAESLVTNGSPREILGISDFVGVAVEAFKVDHCAGAFGYKVVLSLVGQGEAPLSIVYSGDTRPCQSVVKAASGVDLLIHECTMADDLQHEAVSRKHTAISEAIGTVKAARPREAILTHFSQRYAAGPDEGMSKVLEKYRSGNPEEPPISCAFDFMQWFPKKHKNPSSPGGPLRSPSPTRTTSSSSSLPRNNVTCSPFPVKHK